MFHSRSTKKTVEATLPGKPGGAAGGEPTEGEGVPAGVRYTAVLTERPNKSLNRNYGPVRPSANTGMVPTVSQGIRKTGRL